jgi:hypothetical protein
MPLITLVAIVAAGALAVFVLMRVCRLRLRAQFMVLCGLGLSIGFIFLALVELSRFSVTLGILLISIVFVASLSLFRYFIEASTRKKRTKTCRTVLSTSSESAFAKLVSRQVSKAIIGGVLVHLG